MLNIRKLNKDLLKLLEDNNIEETLNILSDLENKGYKHFILCYTKIYDIIYEGRDEDGYPDFSYEYYDRETDTLDSVRMIKNINFDIKKEDDRILLGTDEDTESGDYPSGGTPDHITYSNYNNEYRNRYYLIDYGNKINDLTLSEYILNTYSNSVLASLIKETNISNEDMIEDIDEEDFD